MKATTQEISLATKEQFELVDITEKIEEIVSASVIKNGTLIIFIPHATASLIINENEEGVKEDILARILALAPDNISYKHDQIDNNARAHVIASILGSDKTFIVENGKLVRGTWQNIFFVELDGPRSERRVVVKVFGE